ncbi:hypothetical protein ACMYYO_06080 [Dermacoccaceae bacterium W4C1]
MSNATLRSPAVRLPAARRASTRPKLSVVGAASAPSRNTGFTIVCTVLLAAGLLALLLLNTARAEQSFALSKLQGSSSALTDNQEQIRGELASVSAPQQLALAAQEMGMAPTGQVTYVRASDRKVLGVAGTPSTMTAFTVGTLPDTPASKVADKAVTASSGAVQIAPEKPAENATADQGAKAGSSSSESKASSSASPSAQSSSEASSARSRD